MKHPADCESIEDVREAIDALDREIIYLIGSRARYVEVAAHFKTGEESVRATARQRTMLETRRRWADENGLDPDVIESLYRTLLSYFIDREMQEWRET
ncbi:MAG: chorismate mutase [Rubrobacteraceae bacterium]|nr:chorismate mutase [Rubrobacteraceae bacterium]